ncbi:hypothetical protein DFJ73DRAFT_967671 [Zopfochytrium polystomum]|nr:hypothetical protein DFJ73DRAFT_967671 [Zopfochytrium polystomum]
MRSSALDALATLAATAHSLPSPQYPTHPAGSSRPRASTSAPHTNHARVDTHQHVHDNPSTSGGSFNAPSPPQPPPPRSVRARPPHDRLPAQRTAAERAGRLVVALEVMLEMVVRDVEELGERWRELLAMEHGAEWEEGDGGGGGDVVTISVATGTTGAGSGSVRPGDPTTISPAQSAADLNPQNV